MFKDIVCAITPSEICECAADTAINFSQRFDSKLYFVHVCGMEQGWGHVRHLEASGETERIKQNIINYYEDKLGGVKDSCSVMVVPGMPHSEILRIARKVNSDLIVMGPHTKEYAERRSKMWGMAGSTLEKVSQKARCPVMIVPKSTPYGEQTFSNIIAATDFSEQAECAVAYAGQMARQYKAELTVFHVLDAHNMSQDEIEKGIQAALGRMKEEFEPRLGGIEKCSFECWEGQPSMEILKLGRRKKADVILMAHHTREKDPEKAFLGSTVAQVALNAGCPTMSINRYFDMRCGLMYDQTGEVTEAHA